MPVTNDQLQDQITALRDILFKLVDAFSKLPAVTGDGKAPGWFPMTGGEHPLVPTPTEPAWTPTFESPVVTIMGIPTPLPQIDYATQETADHLAILFGPASVESRDLGFIGPVTAPPQRWIKFLTIYHDAKGAVVALDCNAGRLADALIRNAALGQRSAGEGHLKQRKADLGIVD